MRKYLKCMSEKDSVPADNSTLVPHDGSKGSGRVSDVERMVEQTRSTLVPASSPAEERKQAVLDQWGPVYRDAAQGLIMHAFNKNPELFDEMFGMVDLELKARKAKYPELLYVATYRGISSGGWARYIRLDFPEPDAILGPSPTSLESLLRAKYPSLFSDLEPFVPPSL